MRPIAQIRNWRWPGSRLVRLGGAAVALLLAAIVALAMGRMLARTGGVPRATVRYAGAITVGESFGSASPTFTNILFPNQQFPYQGLLDDSLIGIGQHGRFFPDLATAVPTTSNGGITVVGGDEVITFHLKPGLRWSDGSPITPSDYLAIPLLAATPEGGGIGCYTLRSVTASGRDLRITLNGVLGLAVGWCIPGPMPLEYLQRKYGVRLPVSLTTSLDTDRLAALVAIPAYKGSPLQRLAQKWIQDPYDSPADLFSGPYRIASWPTGRPHILVPNLYYTALPADTHHPRPARIQLVELRDRGDDLAIARSLSEPATYAGMDLAAIYPNTWTSYPQLMLPTLRRSRYRLILQAVIQPELLYLNQANPALRDRRVRQALQHAIDKIGYLRALFSMSAAEAASIALTSPVPPGSPWSIDRELPRNLYNPARARALLAAAGYATGPGIDGRHLQLDFYTTTSPYRELSARLLRRYWAAIGITVRLHFLSGSGIGGVFIGYANGGIVARRIDDIVEQQFRPVPLDPGLYYFGLDPGQIPDQNHPGGANWSGVRDWRLFETLSLAQHSTDEALRHRLYDQFQRYYVDQAYAIPLYDVPEVIAVKPSLGNLKLNGFSPPYWNAFEWYAR